MLAGIEEVTFAVHARARVLPTLMAVRVLGGVAEGGRENCNEGDRRVGQDSHEVRES
jgi:hypothetical protein